ncbi:uncharacterized protein EHS24_001237 [Apiotrichum porosum]|uniref:Major facilitator superfamily (MFS) profile domain-containing protein n=1 Tax=Apiotrichum porosum TaxID=105984 RepID=A0A427XK42_9TREE|nr:uncharacterized protein EHS24_001237 [Apiotrichum porosum]RSH79198.1 hypothetical protein EHS24_001237 [Apiotrichum porosum]
MVEPVTNIAPGEKVYGDIEVEMVEDNKGGLTHVAHLVVTKSFIFLVTIAGLSGILFGYDTGIIGSALPMVGADLGHELSYVEQEIITAGCTIGAIFGGLILGAMADKWGRKWCLVIADIGYSVAQMIVGRLVLGVGVGGASAVAPLYLSELAPTAVRGRTVGTYGFFVPFGQFVSTAIGTGFQAGVPNHISWRVLFGLGAVPSILQLVLMHWLPESPRVLILWGKKEQARETIAKIYKGAPDAVIDFKLRVAVHTVDESTRLTSQHTPWQMTKLLWTHKPYRRALIAVCGVQMFGQLTGFNTLLYYSSRLFGLLGLKNSAAGGLIPAGCNTLFIFIGMTLVDKVGRRGLLMRVAPGMIAGLLWAVVAFYFMTKDTGGQLVEGYAYSTMNVGLVIGAIILFVCSFGATYAHICWYQSEFLPLEIRATGSAIATTANWVPNLVIAVAFLTQLETLTPAGTYGLYLGFVICGYIFAYYCYPETKGLSIDETNLIFQDGFGVKKASEMLKDKKALLAEMREQEALVNA